MSESSRLSQPVIVSAPAGAGKTTHAEALRQMFACSCVIDDWDGVSPVPPGALVLTNQRITPAGNAGE